MQDIRGVRLLLSLLFYMNYFSISLSVCKVTEIVLGKHATVASKPAVSFECKNCGEIARPMCTKQ